ncbi:MAG: DUF4416 family protein [Candidatus Omnitrophica bacterium]|nr:DUF4416 family protein [Candidatus Omnitrophota bacterium]MBU4488881.1 DUF4416 family protein [Candidatus Omnitrophota bacterium]MCG2705469.1 DUF4416 family protein [Candidatus Omnitrophota bacterium]
MGKSAPHKKVKLIIGFIFNDAGVLKTAIRTAVKKWGPVDSESDVLDFCSTDYYQEELGDGLKRKFIGIKRLVSPENIYNLKIETNRTEKVLSRAGKRLVNIDPGYITESKLILLTTKDYGHRIYLGHGIYAEVTLKFQGGSFGPLETTYPDYKREECIMFFNNARHIYRESLKI